MTGITVVKAWDYANDLFKGDGLEPTEDFRKEGHHRTWRGT